MKVQFSPRANEATSQCWIVLQGKLAATDLGLEKQERVKQAAEASRFSGKAGQIFESFVEEGDALVRSILVGAGDGSQSDAEKAGGALVGQYLTSGVSEIGVDVSTPVDGFDDTLLLHFLTAAQLRAWRIDQYRTKLSDNAKPTLIALTIAGASDAVQAEWVSQEAVAQGVALTRELVSEPPNVMYPESFVERCQHLSDLGVEITVLDDVQMEKLGMGALLGVAQGSRKPARLLAMRWDGSGGKQERPLVFVGKGVTFDAGGISIKPAAGMEDMKWDMGGAGAVAGAIKAIAGRKAKAHVVGICGLVENMPDGNAQRPGDIVTSMSGQTIEVINTDAEGRLVLGDALHWAQETYNPEYIVDLATLTGAMIIALGNEHGGLFSNDDGLSDKLLAAAKSSGDPLWRFPLSPGYDKLMNSQIADMKNAGPRGAGSITAAQFLQRFIHEGVKWAHLDIAGMVWADKPGRTWDKGATGFGARLLDRFVAENFES